MGRIWFCERTWEGAGKTGNLPEKGRMPPLPLSCDALPSGIGSAIPPESASNDGATEVGATGVVAPAVRGNPETLAGGIVRTSGNGERVATEGALEDELLSRASGLRSRRAVSVAGRRVSPFRARRAFEATLGAGALLTTSPLSTTGVATGKGVGVATGAILGETTLGETTLGEIAVGAIAFAPGTGAAPNVPAFAKGTVEELLIIVVVETGATARSRSEATLRDQSKNKNPLPAAAKSGQLRTQNVARRSGIFARFCTVAAAMALVGVRVCVPTGVEKIGVVTIAFSELNPKSCDSAPREIDEELAFGA